MVALQECLMPEVDSPKSSTVVSIAVVASALGVEKDVIEQYIEAESLAVTRVNGEWGLNVFVCDKLLTHHFKAKQKEVRFRLFPNLISQIDFDPQNENSRTLKLPKNFNVSEGRKKRIAIEKSLHLALEQLPGGKVGEENYEYYIKAINEKAPEAQQFIEDLAGLYPDVYRTKRKIKQITDELLSVRVAA